MNVNFQPQIEAAARRYGLDPRLLEAVAAQETGGPDSNSGRNVVGDGGHGHGVFQIDDRWHAFARSPEAMDPAANARYAASMIAGNLRRYGGDVKEALSAYNAGDPHATGTRTTWSDGETLGYADSVLRHYRKLGGADAPSPLEAARADDSLNQASISSLASFAGVSSAPGVPLSSAPAWKPRSGLDATGHQRDRAPDYSYIGGDES